MPHSTSSSAVTGGSPAPPLSSNSAYSPPDTNVSSVASALPRSRIATNALRTAASTPPPQQGLPPLPIPSISAASSNPNSIPRPGSSSANSPQTGGAGYTRSPRLPSGAGGRFNNNNSPVYDYASGYRGTAGASTNNNRITQHITSAIAKGYAPQVVPSQPSERPPRTSSLLPPPRIIPNYANPLAPTPETETPPAIEDLLNGSTLNFDTNDVNARDLKQERRRHKRKSSSGLPYTHSRSSSLGGLGDTLRSLNRWSDSTSSSRSPQRASTDRISADRERYSRRMSVEVLGRPRTGGSISGSSPGRKLQKRDRRPSTSAGSPALGRGEAPPQLPSQQGSRGLVGVQGQLPPIGGFGASLEQEIRSESASLAGTPQTYTARQVQDDGGYFSGVFKKPVPQQNGQGSYAVQNGYTTQGSTSGAENGSDSGASRAPAVQNGDPRGHSRNRSQAAKSSVDTTGSSRSRAGSKTPSQKAMLSRALAKANQAVQLDNAQSYQVAKDSYKEACDILTAVLAKTAGEEDQRKLEAIRKTYSDRIAELVLLIPDGGPDQKALPAPPARQDSNASDASARRDSSDEAVIGTAVATRLAPSRPPDRAPPQIPSFSQPRPGTAGKRPGSRGGNSPAIGSYADGRFQAPSDLYSAQAPTSRQLPPRLDPVMTLAPPMQADYMPPPLSPRRPPSRAKDAVTNSPQQLAPRNTDFSMPQKIPMPIPAPIPQAPRPTNERESQETTSWLDPIDESGGSTSSSVHSRTSSLRLTRKHIRTASGDTEAEFDAALDDAIEAAYNDGFEPEETSRYEAANHSETDPEESIANTLRKVELARQRVRESEREALELANERERRLRAQLQMEEEETLAAERMNNRQVKDLEGRDDGGNESEEEERMLEEMTRGFAIEDFAFRPGAKMAGLPRESDSSGLTSRTWHSSMGSNPPTASTALSMVSESTVTPSLVKGSAPPMPPPSMALPPQPGAKLGSGASEADMKENRLSVRSRRLSGQNAKQLKIETPKLGSPQKPVTAIQNPSNSMQLPQPQIQQPRTAGYIVQQRQALSAAGNKSASNLTARQAPSPVPGTMSIDGAPLSTPTLPQVAFPDARAGSPHVPMGPPRNVLRKNQSSSSLKSTKSRNLSVTGDENSNGLGSDVSPATPLSAMGSSSARLPAVPMLPSGLASSYKGNSTTATTTGGLHLFDVGFHSPTTPGSPDTMAPEPPVPLEPCPSDTLLRPFWLMRCLYQTLAHPRGGYLSTKLFVPREAWRVRGVKIKGMEEKIAQCDLLTAALQKLDRVDENDADAVLVEMQSLEGVLEGCQAVLGRKLGSAEVGVQGVSGFFRDATFQGEGEGAVGGGAMPRSASVSGSKSAGPSGGFSWRRLRSKGSSANLNNMANGSKAVTPVEGPASADGLGNGAGKGDTNSGSSGAGVKGDAPTLLASLPMTNQPTSRPSKRDVDKVSFSGPNATYMAALARLFDAAQSIDQIARQVEDPGLRHADKTQVGLELCTRHAAEFFAFYVCRFVLGDLGLLLDKYVKRASEWVLT